MNRNALKQYQAASTHGGIMDANPHRLIQMLMEGVLEKVANAKGFMSRNDIEQKTHHINWAIKIIGGLQDSLDMEAGKDLSQNLNDLYQYMVNKLIEANAENSTEKLDEVTKLMTTIKEGWDGIEEEAKSIFSQKSTPKTASAAV